MVATTVPAVCTTKGWVTAPLTVTVPSKVSVTGSVWRVGTVGVFVAAAGGGERRGDEDRAAEPAQHAAPGRRRSRESIRLGVSRAGRRNR
jgi:hypothetical protein